MNLLITDRRRNLQSGNPGARAGRREVRPCQDRRSGRRAVVDERGDYSQPAAFVSSYSASGLRGLPGHGTPSDCVALGTTSGNGRRRPLRDQSRPNVGNGIWHSVPCCRATERAARMPRHRLQHTCPRRRAAVRHAGAVRGAALELLLPDASLCLVNVNLPQQPSGVAWTRSVRQYTAGSCRARTRWAASISGSPSSREPADEGTIGGRWSTTWCR